MPSEKVEDVTITQMMRRLQFYLLLDTELEDKRDTGHQSRMAKSRGGFW